MPLPSLLFVTNLENNDPAEDRFLARFLSETFTVTMRSPHDADPKGFSRMLIRNAWPNHEFTEDFRRLKTACEQSGTKAYNPFHRNNYLENKRYLGTLCQAGYPVIPTALSAAGLANIPATKSYVVKPLDGDSSRDVGTIRADQLDQVDFSRFIVQPFVKFADEISLFFVDGRFVYALKSKGPERRWDLAEFKPTDVEIAWALRFVKWNAMPYGLQRIDGCRLPNGKILLMEIEDQCPKLSLRLLSRGTRHAICKALRDSLVKNLV